MELCTQGKHRIGGKYIKSIYREYSDSTVGHACVFEGS